jgi:hypothetical protein
MPFRAISHGWKVQRESAMTTAIRPKARDLIAQTWQSHANLSLFPVLLVISIFVTTGDGRTARQYQAGVGRCGITYAEDG